MGNNLRGFWYQVHSSYLCQRPGPRRPSGRVRRTPIRRSDRSATHEWKIGWHDLPTGLAILESIRRWRNKPKGVWGGNSINISWEDHYWEIAKNGFSTTNNEIEYKTLLMGMTMVQKMVGKMIEMFSDSRLVVGQVKGEFEARDKRMQDRKSVV